MPWSGRTKGFNRADFHVFINNYDKTYLNSLLLAVLLLEIVNEEGGAAVSALLLFLCRVSTEMPGTKLSPYACGLLCSFLRIVFANLMLLFNCNPILLTPLGLCILLTTIPPAPIHVPVSPSTSVNLLVLLPAGVSLVRTDLCIF